MATSSGPGRPPPEPNIEPTELQNDLETMRLKLLTDYDALNKMRQEFVAGVR